MNCIFSFYSIFFVHILLGRNVARIKNWKGAIEMWWGDFKFIITLVSIYRTFYRNLKKLGEGENCPMPL